MTKFSPELFSTICENLADGKSLRSICRASDMPSKAAVMKWLNEKPELVDQYARAREMQADTLFDDCLSIADQYDAIIEAKDPDHIHRAKLRIDTRKWMAGKLRPKKYGDRLGLDVNNVTPAKTEDELIEQARKLGINPAALGLTGKTGGK